MVSSNIALALHALCIVGASIGVSLFCLLTAAARPGLALGPCHYGAWACSSSSTTEVRSHRSRPLRLVDTLGEALTIQGSNDDLFTSGSDTESVVPLAHPRDDRSTTPRDPPEIADASWDTPGRPPDGL